MHYRGMLEARITPHGLPIQNAAVRVVKGMSGPIRPSRRTRRELLKMAPLAAAGVLFSGTARDAILRQGLAFSDGVSGALFRGSHLARTFRDADVTPLDRFPLNSYLVDDPEIDLDAWTLDVSGLVQSPGSYSLDALRALPKVVQNTQHICVEG